MHFSSRVTKHSLRLLLYVWIGIIFLSGVLRFPFFFFFFFFNARVSAFKRQNVLFMESTTILFRKKYNRFHNTIRIFKNYFITIFLIFNF